MSYGQVYIAQRNMNADRQDKLRNAEEWRARRQARAHHQGSLSGYSHRLLGRTSLLLVTLGARLVRYGLPPYGPIEGEPSAGGQSVSPA